MNTKLVKLSDSTLIEVEVSQDEAQQISGGIVKTVDSTLEKIQPILKKVMTPIVSTWKELNKDMHIEQAEVEIGLSFEGEGNLYITKSKAGANLTVKLTLKP